jgi:Icc-related predicted phosphoesterase
MSLCYFVSDLHGNIQNYKILMNITIREKPSAIFLGGDLLPSSIRKDSSKGKPIHNFIKDFLYPEFIKLKSSLGENFPHIYLILGNDDPKKFEKDLVHVENTSLWSYVHMKKVFFKRYPIFGYSYVPPTPFMMKDWEKYDISRYLEPGCIAPEDGWYSTHEKDKVESSTTIKDDLQLISGTSDLSNTIILFHAPPYQTNLDRAALDGKYIDHAPLDVHVGSIAIKTFIIQKQPLLTLHGHIHESTRLTGSWIEKTGRTYSFSAAHDGTELALVRFDPSQLELATRELIT